MCGCLPHSSFPSSKQSKADPSFSCAVEPLVLRSVRKLEPTSRNPNQRLLAMAAATTAPAPPAATPMAPPPSYPASSAASASTTASAEDDDDLYGRLKSLQRHMEFVEIQEEYVKDEQKNLKRELLRAQEEVKRIQSVPLVIGQFMEMVDGNNGIVGSTTGSNYYVRILSTINRELLKPSASVALHRHSNALVDVLPPEADSSISLLGSSEKPNVTYNVSFFSFLLDPHVNLTFSGSGAK